jgi:hypothetical protein
MKSSWRAKNMDKYLPNCGADFQSAAEAPVEKKRRFLPGTSPAAGTRHACKSAGAAGTSARATALVSPAFASPQAIDAITIARTLKETFMQFRNIWIRALS